MIEYGLTADTASVPRSSPPPPPPLALLDRFSQRVEAVRPDGPNEPAHMLAVIFQGLKDRTKAGLTPIANAAALMEQGRKTEEFAKRQGLPGDWKWMAKQAGKAARANNANLPQVFKLRDQIGHACAHSDRSRLKTH